MLVYTIKRRIRELNDSLQDPGTREWEVDRAIDMLQRIPRGELTKQEKKRKFRPTTLVGGALENRGDWLAASGTHRILTGDLGGWEEFHLSWQYRAWSDFVFLAEFEAGLRNDLGTHRPDALLTVAAAIALDEREFTRQFSPRMEATLEREGFDWGWHGFYPFIWHLSGLWLGLDLPMDHPGLEPMEPYSHLLQVWNDPEQVSEGLLWMCEDRMVDLGAEREWNLFMRRLVIDFPAEILAVVRVRHDAGLETPLPKHVFLESPMAHPPDPIPRAVDPLVDSTIAWLRQSLPQLENVAF
ncbi:MAG: hypothetical protein U1E05_03030 [Patescibacteria group bacterium]|nr:hypothetical protein [Patescibacteria group bacterium]